LGVGGFVVINCMGGFGLVVGEFAFLEVIVARVFFLLELLKVIFIVFEGEFAGGLFRLASDFASIMVHFEKGC